MKGAAWSLPVIATAVAIPSASASPGCTPGREVLTAGATGSALAVSSVTVPATASRITFTVVGGGGGGPQTGGLSASRTGEIPVTGMAQTFTLVAGQQGHPRTGPATSALGYGNGGPSYPGIETFYPNNASGGGAGSAIILGPSTTGTPLVVVGGGGGAGANSGAGIAFSGAGGSRSTGGNGVGDSWAPAGQAANGATGGAAVTGVLNTSITGNASAWTSRSLAGDNHGAGALGGGDGTSPRPDRVYVAATGQTSPAPNSAIRAAGGAGGGYAAGSAGTASTWGSATSNTYHFSGGGRGSDYLAPTVVSTSFTDIAAQPGSVIIEWTC